MENLGTFVGIPDWRSAVLALLFALPWLLLLGWAWFRARRERALVALGALALAAVLFAPSIAWVQVPIQRALGALLIGRLGQSAVARYWFLAGLPGLLAASLVQEVAKLLVAVAALRIVPGERGARPGLALGGAAGAGYGGFEAFWTFNLILAQGWSWATVQLGGPLALAGFYERLYAVPFHAASVALSAYGYATGRPWRFLGLAVALHTLVNYGVLLLGGGVLSPVAMEAWGTLFAGITIALALWLRRRQAPEPVSPPAEQAG